MIRALLAVRYNLLDLMVLALMASALASGRWLIVPFIAIAGWIVGASLTVWVRRRDH